MTSVRVLAADDQKAGDGRRKLLAPRQPSTYPAWSGRDRGPVPAFPLATLGDCGAQPRISSATWPRICARSGT